MTSRPLIFAISLLLAACSQSLHTPENTEHLSDAELAALCEDLYMRANMDCQWNMREQQSTVGNQQTWEINCRARRDSARESFDNVCGPWRVNRTRATPENPDRR